MCYVALVRLDSIYLQPFAEKLGDPLRLGGGRQRFQPVANYLQALKPGGSTKFFDITRDFISRYPQRGLVIVISDFLDDAGCEKPLQYLTDFGHEMILIHVWADEDREPPWDGELDLEDAESGTRVQLAFDDSARAQYTCGVRRIRAANCATWRCAMAGGMLGCRRRFRSKKLFSGLWCGPAPCSKHMNFLNLSFGELLGLAGIVSAGIVALYLLDRTKRKQVVATLRFWTAGKLPEELKHKRRVHQPWSLLLQVISMILLLLAIAGPRFGDLGTSRDHVLLLDTSAWMGARARAGDFAGSS